MHESEVGFQSIIDPYARGDFFLSFGEEGVNLEEGYITFTALPGSFVAKVGAATFPRKPSSGSLTQLRPPQPSWP
jgi:hypothetical protein